MAKKWNWNNTQVLYLSDGSYIFGSIEKGKVNLLKKFKNLKEAKTELGLVEPKKWLRMRSLPLEYDKTLYECIHCREYYIVSPPIEPSEKEWAKHWESGTNEKCARCEKLCKESHFITVLDCPDYKKYKGE